MQEATLHDISTDTDLVDAAVLRLLLGESPSAPRWLTSACAGASLFVRPCYGVLFLLATTFLAHTHEPHNVVVTGSHGVGKRSFLSYVFYRLRQLPSPPTIVLDTPGRLVCVAADGTIRLGDRDESFQSELADRATIYLRDAASGVRTSTIRVRAKTLVVLSPRRGHREVLTGDTQRVTFVMPPWSTPELAACRDVCYPHVSPKELKQRQEAWGGLVRWVLAEPLAMATAQFARSLAQLTLDKAAALVENREIDSNHENMNEAHFLIQIEVESNDTFLPHETRLCSARACAVLVGTSPSSDHVIRFLKIHRANLALRGLLHQIEDQLMRDLLVV